MWYKLRRPKTNYLTNKNSLLLLALNSYCHHNKSILIFLCNCSTNTLHICIFTQFHTKTPILNCLYQIVARSFSNSCANFCNNLLNSYRLMKFKLWIIGQNLYADMEDFCRDSQQLQSVLYQPLMMALISLHDNYCFNDCRPVRPCKNSDKTSTVTKSV